ncbi:hypothetical protein DFH27DRAFT_224008 [Peziza echinospora]|nr:hypothetical protein DFH27DRAFT_224008 [Peziza echinospora]
MALKRSHTVFRSPMFKIILKTKSPVQAEATFTPASTPDPDPSSLTSSSDGDDLEEIYYVHNDVLSTSAPKFHAHACNNIPDGFKNSLHLTEVEAETLQLFLKWVYEGDYRPSNYVTGEAHLLSDAKLYIFADRFDIQDLGELVMNRIASRLTPRPANLKVMPIEAMVRGAFGEDLIEEVFDVMV